MRWSGLRKQDRSTQSQNNIRKSKRQIRREAKQYEKKQRWKRGREIYIAGYLMVALFLGMLAYFFYFEGYGKNAILVNSKNNRTQNMVQSMRKGSIVTSDGVEVALTQILEDGTQYREYPFRNIYAHTVGYVPKGGAGLESTQKIRLLMSHDVFLEQLRQEIMNQRVQGDTLHITLNHQLQAFCYQQLAGKAGAIVVMEPKTGKVLAMTSTPDFDPQTVSEQWDTLLTSTDAIFMNRASQGRYAPGSTFKLITLLEYIRENPDTWQDFSYSCTGTYVDGDYVINCHEGHAHGDVDIYGALAQSCNGAFVTMGRSLDPVKWKKLCEDFGYNDSKTGGYDFQYNKSSFSITEDSSLWDRMQASIGQGTTTATPLLNTMITSAIANGGVMMKPYLIDSYTSADQTWQSITEPEVLRQSISADEASLLTEFMTKVISEGSGYLAGSAYCQVAGKTGSAQYSSQAGLYHAWFTGFAPAEDPQIAVTVLIEQGGSGGEVAAPIAGAIFNYYFSLQQ